MCSLKDLVGVAKIILTAEVAEFFAEVAEKTSAFLCEFPLPPLR
jgi:hypothetical protein